MTTSVASTSRLMDIRTDLHAPRHIYQAKVYFIVVRMLLRTSQNIIVNHDHIQANHIMFT